jgi:hypothetical protein
MAAQAPAAVETPGARLRAFLSGIKPALTLATGAFVVLAAFAGHRFWHQSRAPHFVYQAMAFLEGHLELTVPPPNMEDWAFFNGKWYSSFPAFPALLMVPLVALWGYQFNDTSFTVIVAALNLVFFFLALRKLSDRGDSPRTLRENLIFTALLSFGTLYFYCSIRGEVWFTAEVMGVGCTALYVYFARGAEQPALAGLCFAAGVLTRTPIMFSVVFFLCELFLPNGSLADLSAKLSDAQKKERLTKLLQFAAGALPLALWHMWLNQARFGSPTDFGHTHFFNNRVNADIQQYGLFNTHYLERNLRAALLYPPWVELPGGRTQFPAYNPHGLSLLVTTPLFLFSFFPKKVDGKRPRLFLALALTVAAMALPGLLYQNDGYIQFGFRFSLDWTPYMILLLAIGRRKLDNVWWVLALVGVVVNTWGAIAFKGYSDMF